jgi:hypothetical protein
MGCCLRRIFEQGKEEERMGRVNIFIINKEEPSNDEKKNFGKYNLEF